MNSFKILTAENWPRWKQYEFYRTFANPMYDITVALNARPIQIFADQHAESFFLLTLYAFLRAANDVPQLRQREENGQIVEYEHIAVTTPILTKEELLNEVWCEYATNFQNFKAQTQPLIEQAKEGIADPVLEERQDFFCASCIPWLHFQAGTIADCLFHQSIPVLAWGKIAEGKIPVMMKFNHCFVDGFHFSRFFNGLELYFAEPERLY